MFSLKDKTVWIAGHGGMVGQALLRQPGLAQSGILTVDRATLDLREQAAVRDWIKQHKPDVIILAAATVGGIEANRTRPADFLYDNIMIASNVIHVAAENHVGKLLYLGSSCIYPRDAAQPITEDALMTGPLEPTNEWYALAKIAGVKLCQAYRRQQGCDFIAAMPCNLYGPGDTYDAVASHVIPALILKLDAARREKQPSVTLWGSGTPLREFLYVDDLADALIKTLTHYSAEAPINIGGGIEISIMALAGQVAEAVGFEGEILFDPSMPDGTPRKVLDSSQIRAYGWQPSTPLATGLARTVALYRAGMAGA